MSYIGNQVTTIPHIVDVFNGDSSDKTFTLTRAPAGSAAIAVFVGGSYKTPGVDYTVSSDVVTFGTAPASGTNNVVVHHLGNGSITQVPSDGSVTGNKLTPNLAVNLTTVNETINVTTTAIGGNITLHLGNSSQFYFASNTTANITFNLVANDSSATSTSGRLDELLNIGQKSPCTITLKQGSTRFRANVFIDGQRANSIFWKGNAQPLYQTSRPESIDVYDLSVIKIAANAFTVIAGNTAHSYANGQGVSASGTVY